MEALAVMDRSSTEGVSVQGADPIELLESGRIAEARALLLARVEVDPGYRRGWMLLAAIALRSSDWELGRRSCGALLDMRPDHAIWSSGLVDCLCELGQYRLALEEIDRFMSVVRVDSASARPVIEEHRQRREWLVANLKRQSGGCTDLP